MLRTCGVWTSIAVIGLTQQPPQSTCLIGVLRRLRFSLGMY